MKNGLDAGAGAPPCCLKWIFGWRPTVSPLAEPGSVSSSSGIRLCCAYCWMPYRKFGIYVSNLKIPVGNMWNFYRNFGVWRYISNFRYTALSNDRTFDCCCCCCCCSHSRVFAKIRFWKNSWLPLKKVTCLPTQVFGVFALEVNKILQATPSKLRREMGICATTTYVQQQQ